MKKIFSKAMKWTIITGVAAIGVYVGLAVCKLSLQMVQLMLGSALGTAILAVIGYCWISRHWDEIFG